MKTQTASISKLCLLVFGCCSNAFAQAPTRNDVIEVPFEFYRTSIIVQAKVNGKGPFNMLLDTGVDPSVVDLNTAKGIGLIVASVGQQGTGSGTDINLGYETKLPLVELGGLTATNIEAEAVNLSKTSAALGKPIDGVLGYSLLKDRIVQIDYPKHVVRFYANSPATSKANQPNTEKFTTLSFQYHDDILIDGVSVDGKRIIANLDTGSNGGFQLTPAAVAEIGLEQEVSKARMSKSVGFNGSTENREGKIKNVTVGGISVAEPNVVFYGKGTGRDDEGWGIRIGNAFLKDFTVTIDYQSHVITLERP
jgi:predicted aspartyl protease